MTSGRRFCPQYVRALKNFKAEQPMQHAAFYTSVLMTEQMWNKDELLEVTDGESLEAVRIY